MSVETLCETPSGASVDLLCPSPILHHILASPSIPGAFLVVVMLRLGKII